MSVFRCGFDKNADEYVGKSTTKLGCIQPPSAQLFQRLEFMPYVVATNAMQGKGATAWTA